MFVVLLFILYQIISTKSQSIYANTSYGRILAEAVTLFRNMRETYCYKISQNNENCCTIAKNSNELYYISCLPFHKISGSKTNFFHQSNNIFNVFNNFFLLNSQHVQIYFYYFSCMTYSIHPFLSNNISIFQY